MRIAARINNMSLTFYEDGTASIFVENEECWALVTLAKKDCKKILKLLEITAEGK